VPPVALGQQPALALVVAQRRPAQQAVGGGEELEAENAKLKRMYAELALENTAIKDVLSRKL
jgi:hypothetical protein